MRIDAPTPPPSAAASPRRARRRPAARPATPRHAAACCGPLDDLLDPALFRALGDPTRIRLLACLIKCARPCGVGELAECCDVDLSVVSRHLRLLRGAGVVAAAKSGRAVRYTAKFDHLSRMLRALGDAVAAHRPAAAASSCSGACCA